MAYRLIGMVLVLMLSYYFLYPAIFRCQTIRFSGFQSISEQIWVSPAVPESEYGRIKIIAELGAYRNRLFWGERKGNATIIVCETLEEYNQFCHSKQGAGCSISTPLSDAYIILNRHYLNLDVVSHEMCHNELYERLGWVKATFVVPQWFHEGVALMLDYRFVATNNSQLRVKSYERELRKLRRRGYPKVTLADLHSLEGFVQKDAFATQRAYMTAGYEISGWLLQSKQASLPSFLQEIKEGKDFLVTYGRYKKLNGE